MKINSLVDELAPFSHAFPFRRTLPSLELLIQN